MRSSKMPYILVLKFEIRTKSSISFNLLKNLHLSLPFSFLHCRGTDGTSNKDLKIFLYIRELYQTFLFIPTAYSVLPNLQWGLGQSPVVSNASKAFLDVLY